MNSGMPSTSASVRTTSSGKTVPSRRRPSSRRRPRALPWARSAASSPQRQAAQQVGHGPADELVRPGAERLGRGAVGGLDAAVGPEGQDPLGRVVDDRAQARLALPQAAGGLREPQGGQLVLGPAGEVVQARELLLVERPRRPVDEAQGPHRPAVGQQGPPRVEAHARLARHPGVVREALVARRVGDDERPLAQDRVGAERHRARRLGHVDADAGLEPLAVGVDERHERDRDAEERRGHARDAVEALLGGESRTPSSCSAARRAGSSGCSSAAGMAPVCRVPGIGGAPRARPDRLA